MHSSPAVDLSQESPSLNEGAGYDPNTNYANTTFLTAQYDETDGFYYDEYDNAWDEEGVYYTTYFEEWVPADPETGFAWFDPEGTGGLEETGVENAGEEQVEDDESVQTDDTEERLMEVFALSLIHI